MRAPVILCAVSVFIGFIGCNRSSNVVCVDDSNAIVAEISQIEERPVDISEFVDSVTFVTLETVPESLVAQIDQVMFVDSMIVLTDTKIGSLFFFDRNGKYLRKINRRGRGPGEYFDITKTLWNEQRKELLIWSLASRGLFFYSIDGTFLRSIGDFNDRLVIRDIIPTADGGYLCYRADRSRGSTPDNLTGLWRVDSIGNSEQILIERTTIHPLILSQFLFNLYPLSNGEIGLIDQYSANIYHTDGHSIRQYVRFDMPWKRLEDFPGVDDIEVSEPFVSLHHHTEKGDMVLTEWIGSKVNYFVSLYSKRDGTVQVGRNVSVMVEGQPMPVMMNVATNDPSIMVSTISPLTIESILDSPQAPDGLKAIVGKLVEGKERGQIESMNPVLMLLHVQNNQSLFSN
jgi:hypothetical protein